MQKQRRNLIAVSVGLAVYELADGSAEKISLMGGGIELQDPERVIQLGYIALIYFLWRYWLYARPEHNEFNGLIRSKMKSFNGYKNLVEPHVTTFRENSGVAAKESMWQEMDELSSDEINKIKRNIPVHLLVEVETKLFQRNLVIKVDDTHGDFKQNHEIKKLGFFRYELLWLRALAQLVIGDKTFSDMYVPYFLALVAIVGIIYRWQVV